MGVKKKEGICWKHGACLFNFGNLIGGGGGGGEEGGCS